MDIEVLRTTLQKLPVGRVITKRQLRAIGIELTDFQKLVDLDLFSTIEPHCAWRYHTATLTFEDIFKSIEDDLGYVRIGGLGAMLFHSDQILFLSEICWLYIKPGTDFSCEDWVKHFDFALRVDEIFDFHDQAGKHLDFQTARDVVKGVRYSSPGRAFLEYLANPEVDSNGQTFIPPKSYFEEYKDEIQALVPYCKNKAVMQRLADWYGLPN